MSAHTHDPEATVKQLAIACLTTAVGGLLLGVQLDTTGRFVGTGRTTLGIGALVSLLAVLVTSLRAARQTGSAWLPRDVAAALASGTAFFGFASAVGAVLAPGGSWMFFEVGLLVGLIVLRRRTAGALPELTPGMIGLLALMLLFRLWVTYQGSEHRWAVVELEVPLLSAIPFGFLDPVRHVSLGAFTPHELGFPPAGLDFNVSVTLWSLGFVLTVIGILWIARAGGEHEDDRVHATILQLPPGLASLVSRLLPEEEWRQLGLHGLSERRRRKRIETLVRRRVSARREFEAALRQADLQPPDTPSGFAVEIFDLLTGREALPPGRPPAPPGGEERP